MSKKLATNNGGLVYSTNKEIMNEAPQEAAITLQPAAQRLRVRTDSKHRAGKLVTLVEGFEGKTEDLEALGKTIKTKCGTGGSVKEGQIIIQGDYKEKILLLLKTLGYVSSK